MHLQHVSLIICNQSRSRKMLLTGTLHGQPFTCACRLLTNRRAAPKVDNLQEARGLFNGRQAQEKGCLRRGPVTK